MTGYREIFKFISDRYSMSGLTKHHASWPSCLQSWSLTTDAVNGGPTAFIPVSDRNLEPEGGRGSDEWLDMERRNGHIGEQSRLETLYRICVPKLLNTLYLFIILSWNDQVMPVKMQTVIGMINNWICASLARFTFTRHCGLAQCPYFGQGEKYWLK